MQKLIYSQRFSLRDISVGPSKYMRFEMFIGPMIGFGGGIGPVGIEGGPRWRGDHSFSSSSISYSLRHFLEPSILQANPDWTPQKVKEAARKEMAIALWENRDFSSRERKREKEISKKWIVIESSPGVFELSATWGNQQYTLRELWEHMYEATHDLNNPETYNPAAYNEQEAKAQLAVEKALLSGEATSALIPLSDVDSFRYAQVWEMAADGVVNSKVVDFGKVMGRDVSFDEATTLARHVGRLYEKNVITGGDSSYPVVMINEGTIQTEDIQIIAKFQSYTTESYVGKKERMTDMPMAVNDIATKVTSDVYRSFIDVGKFSSHAIHQKIQQFRKDMVESKVATQKIPLFLRFLGGQIDMSEKKIPESTIPKQRKNLLFEAPLLRGSNKRKRKENVVIQFVKKQSIKNNEPFVPMRTIVEKIRVSKKEKKQKNTKKQILTREQKKFAIHTERKGKEKMKRVKKKIIGREKSRARIHFEHKRKFFKKEKQRIKRKERIIMGEKKYKQEKRVVRLWKFLRKFAKKLNEKTARSEIIRKSFFIKEKKFITKRETKKKVIKFIFALIFWMTTRVELKEIKLGKKTEKKISEKTTEKMSTQWALLAIIWYLNAIREQGIPVVYKKQKKKKGKQAIFPQKGVIFMI